MITCKTSCLSNILKQMKKIFYTIFSYMFLFHTTYSAWPEINCEWLPLCNIDNNENAVLWTWTYIVSEMIKYVAVIAVLSVMLSWIMYLLSWWEEEKVKKAKSWIIWSLVGVFLSVSAWAIIKTVNEITI